MYQGYAATDMKTLLYGMKALTKSHMDGSNSTNLKSVNTLKRGILSNANTIYPAISFIPIQEELKGYRNGGLYRVDRYTNIEVYVKLQRVEDTSKHLQEVCHYIKGMFEDDASDWQFPNSDEDATVFSYSPGAIQYEVISGRDQLIQRATLPYTFSSWEETPTFTTSSTIGQYDLRSIGEYLYTQLKADTTLSEVKFFFSHSFPPITVGSGVVVSVLENLLESNRREAGRDNPTGYLDTMVWTKASPFEGSLDLNLETVELIKDVVQADQHFGGRCFRSYIDRILFGINEQASLYSSRIMIDTWAYKNITQEAAAAASDVTVGDEQ
jgi:hypothetical protein